MSRLSRLGRVGPGARGRLRGGRSNWAGPRPIGRGEARRTRQAGGGGGREVGRGRSRGGEGGELRKLKMRERRRI